MFRDYAFFKLLAKYFSHGTQTNELTFQSNGFLTLGVEIELQLIDPETFNLVSRSEEFLKAGAKFSKLKPELFQTMTEINTDKCNDVREVEKDLTESFNTLDAISQQLNIKLATTACHPFGRYADSVITPTPRYHELIDRNQWLARRTNVYGMHVHIGMKSGDDCIRFNNFFLHFLPHLLAFSASSPFWQGEDTGLASCRPTTYEALPTAGQPYRVNSWQEFESLYQTLKKADAVRSLKDLWWDMRPSPNFGTLEIRVCDGLATLSESLAVTAYIHLLAHWFSDHGDWLEQVPTPPRWLARENKWRVMRHGLEARLVTSLDGETRPIRDDINLWLEKLSVYSDRLGYGAYVQTLRDICSKGNSSSRQRGVYERTNSLPEVAELTTKEFINRSPLWHI